VVRGEEGSTGYLLQLWVASAWGKELPPPLVLQQGGKCPALCAERPKRTTPYILVACCALVATKEALAGWKPVRLPRRRTGIFGLGPGRCLSIHAAGATCQAQRRTDQWIRLENCQHFAHFATSDISGLGILRGWGRLGRQSDAGITMGKSTALFGRKRACHWPLQKFAIISMMLPQTKTPLGFLFSQLTLSSRK